MEENERKLGPMAFERQREHLPWGVETYNIADLGFIDTKVLGGWLDGNSLSDIMETYLEKVVGDNAFYYYGRQFPLMVKHMDFSSRQPLLVCPDDTVAAQRYDALGKAKFWYVISAREGAYVGLGLRKNMTASAFYYACEDRTVPDYVNRIPVRAGDCFHIAPGIVHYASEGVQLIEVAEASALDFVLCRPLGMPDDELGTADALDFVNLSKSEYSPLEKKDDYKLLSTPEMTVSLIPLGTAVKVNAGDSDSFYIYTCAKGEASLLGGGEMVVVREGESVLVPADCTEFVIEPRREGTVMIEAAPTRREEKDGYIDR